MMALQTDKIGFLPTLGVWSKLGPEPLGSYVKLAPIKRKCWERLTIEHNLLREASLRENGEGVRTSEWLSFMLDQHLWRKERKKGCRGNC